MPGRNDPDVQLLTCSPRNPHVSLLCFLPEQRSGGPPVVRRGPRRTRSPARALLSTGDRPGGRRAARRTEQPKRLTDVGLQCDRFHPAILHHRQERFHGYETRCRNPQPPEARTRSAQDVGPLRPRPADGRGSGLRRGLTGAPPPEELQCLFVVGDHGKELHLGPWEGLSGWPETRTGPTVDPATNFQPRAVYRRHHEYRKPEQELSEDDRELFSYHC